MPIIKSTSIPKEKANIVDVVANIIIAIRFLKAANLLINKKIIAIKKLTKNAKYCICKNKNGKTNKKIETKIAIFSTSANMIFVLNHFIKNKFKKENNIIDTTINTAQIGSWVGFSSTIIFE